MTYPTAATSGASTAKHNIRYVAEWIIWQSSEDAAVVTYDYDFAVSLNAAKTIAVKRGKKANVVEWVGVREQEWTKRNVWLDTGRRWGGDWTGFWEQTAP